MLEKFQITILAGVLVLVQRALAQCSNGEVYCNGTKKCLPISDMCNGVNNCGNCEDEWACGHKYKSWIARGRCPSDHFLCMETMTCISQLFICDGSDDCGDCTDEVRCGPNTKIYTSSRCKENEFYCYHSKKCISKASICDGNNDCLDWDDEKRCGRTTVTGTTFAPSIQTDASTVNTKCSKGFGYCNATDICIPADTVCNGENDCGDCEDEMNCNFRYLLSKAKQKCNSEQFYCVKHDGCIPKENVCDGYNDCGDCTDELRCHQDAPIATSNFCLNDEFYCQDTGFCVGISDLCDGYNDCGDWEDEKRCHPYKFFPQNVTTFSSVTPESSASTIADHYVKCTSLEEAAAKCSQNCNRTHQGVSCFCQPGYHLLPDDRSCEDVDECLIPGLCSHFCSNTEGSFECSCAFGYVLQDNGRTCVVEGKSLATLVYLLPDQIIGIDIHRYNRSVYISNAQADIRGMDYDALTGDIFYTEWIKKTITRYSLKNDEHKVLLNTPRSPYYIRWDWVSKKIYYTDEGKSIHACTHDGKYCMVVVPCAGPQISAMDIAPLSGFIFWGVRNWDLISGYGVIQRADMDGSQRKLIIWKNVFWPSSLTVDIIMEEIYWIDRSNGVVSKAGFDGYHRNIVAEKLPYVPLSITLFEDHIFWSDATLGHVIACDKFQITNCTRFPIADAKSERIMVTHKALQPKGENRCENKGCPEICLLASTSSICSISSSNDFECDIKGKMSMPDEWLYLSWMLGVIIALSIIVLILSIICICMLRKKNGTLINET